MSYCKVIEVDYLDSRYRWNGRRWSDEHFLAPPEAVVKALNALAAGQLAAHDDEICSADRLLRQAVAARREQKDSVRALRLARRALEIDSGCVGAVAVICAVHRGRGRPDLALEETSPFAGEPHPPLLTSRAAAMCDLGLWDQARRTIGRALALSTQASSGEAFAVVRRIKKHRPDLYL